jgi:hypothetical protein
MLALREELVLLEQLVLVTVLQLQPNRLVQPD